MAINSPFVRSIYRPYKDQTQPSGGCYLVETASRHREPVAIATQGQENNLIYTPNSYFIQKFSNWPLGDVQEWNNEKDLEDWIEKIFYYSFLEHSFENADRAWFVKRITDNNPYVRPTLPAGYQHILQRYNREVWILLKNGSRVWPVQIVDNQFRGGWTEFYRAHALSSDYEIFFGCERNWIYEVAIFDQYHARVKYSWSSPNESLEFIYPPPAGLRTSILPSIFFNQQASMQFSYRCEQGTHIYQEFATRLGPILSNIEEYEVVFKMDLHEWTVPVQQGVLHRSTFEAFIADLKLGTSDYVLITMSPQMVARVIVFGFNGLEKVSSMF